MKLTMLKQWLSVILCMVLIAAMALLTTGCGDKSQPTPTDALEKTFTFIVVDGKGAETTFQITSDKSTVGEALLDEELIAGEQGDYGMYIKTVNGITADYETDGTYWAFYVNGDYATSGVDTTQIQDGATYSLKVEQ